MRLLLAGLAISSLAWAADDPKLKGFHDGVNAYHKILQEASKKVPALPKEAKPEEIEKHEKALVAAIRAARPNAKQGDVFTPEAQTVFFAILKRNLSGAGNKDSRAAIKEGNPKHEKEPGEAEPVIQVNAVYPKSAALSTVPAGLLQQLPQLPMALEYRFVGRTLILWDNESNLIIDYMKEAAPAL
jgi:hypothetical protein